MMKIFLSILTLYMISVFANETDLNLNNVNTKVASAETLYQNHDGTKAIVMYESLFQDGFKTVTEGKYMIWNEALTSICDYVKIFITNGNIDVIKVGTTDKPDEGFQASTFVALYFIKEKGVWYRVDRGLYLRLIKGKYPNFVVPRLEVEENVPKGMKNERVVEAVKESDEETKAKADEEAKKLQDARAKEEVAKASRPSTPTGAVDQGADSWEGPSDSEEHSDKVPLLKPKEPGERGHKSPKEGAKQKGKKSSFLAASVLLPSLLMLFPLF